MFIIYLFIYLFQKSGFFNNNTWKKNKNETFSNDSTHVLCNPRWSGFARYFCRGWHRLSLFCVLCSRRRILPVNISLEIKRTISGSLHYNHRSQCSRMDTSPRQAFPPKISSRNQTHFSVLLHVLIESPHRYRLVVAKTLLSIAESSPLPFLFVVVDLFSAQGLHFPKAIWILLFVWKK